MKRRQSITIVAGFLMFSTLALDAHSRSGVEQSNQPPATSSGDLQEAIRLLREIRDLLVNRLDSESNRKEYPTVTLTVRDNEPFLGARDAPLTMVDYTDLQCQFCAQFAATTFAEIKKNWIDPGKLKYVARDLPLDFHLYALPAARAARCSGEQGRFWEMRHKLVTNAHRLSPEVIQTAAEDLGLDQRSFGACIATRKYDEVIRATVLDAMRVGIQGTPTFVVGRTREDGVEGQVLTGAMRYEFFDRKLQEVLRESRSRQ